MEKERCITVEAVLCKSACKPLESVTKMLTRSGFATSRLARLPTITFIYFGNDVRVLVTNESREHLCLRSLLSADIVVRTGFYIGL